MATSRKRVTVNLSEKNAEYINGIAQQMNKTQSWVIEKIIDDHRSSEAQFDKSKKQLKKIKPDYDEDNPFIEKR